MEALCREEMASLEGEGFLGGFACGLGVVSAFAMATSPDPFSKLALLTYGSTMIGCAAAF